jgi:hypothetical protein
MNYFLEIFINFLFFNSNSNLKNHSGFYRAVPSPHRGGNNSKKKNWVGLVEIRANACCRGRPRVPRKVSATAYYASSRTTSGQVVDVCPPATCHLFCRRSHHVNRDRSPVDGDGSLTGAPRAAAPGQLLPSEPEPVEETVTAADLQ